jgi:hypothetical protein
LRPTTTAINHRASCANLVEVKVGPEFAIDAHEEVERNAYNSAIAMHLVKRRSARKSSEPAKPGQQVIIYRLRPLLLSPVAAAWKQVKPP